MKLSHGLIMTILALLAIPPTSSAFSEESLKDLSRLPHLQRHWLQRLDQVNKRNKVTTSQPPPSVAATTDATEESIEVVEDERIVTTANPTKDVVDAGTKTIGRGSSAGGGGGATTTLTISEAKEKLKARRIKSRKRTGFNEEEDQQQQHQPAHQYQYKRTDDIYSPGHTEEETIEVKKHIQRMTNATCGKPMARLVYVHQQHETAPNVRYLPSCTWLYRCSDDIGCCTDNAKTCSASNIESISLPFFVLTMIGVETKRTITRLSFENHTSCECVGRNSDIMPRTEPDIRPPPPVDADSVRSYQSVNREKVENQSSKTKKPTQDGGHISSGRLSFGDDLMAGGGKRNTSDSVRQPSVRPLRLKSKSSIHFKRCSVRCPLHYTPMPIRKRSCGCQCGLEDHVKRRDRHRRRSHHHHHRCHRLYKGLEFFSQNDRGCIIKNKCQVPTCEYGRYLALIGRCPRRGERNPLFLS